MSSTGFMRTTSSASHLKAVSLYEPSDDCDKPTVQVLGFPISHKEMWGRKVKVTSCVNGSWIPNIYHYTIPSSFNQKTPGEVEASYSSKVELYMPKGWAEENFWLAQASRIQLLWLKVIAQRVVCLHVTDPESIPQHAIWSPDASRSDFWMQSPK